MKKNFTLWQAIVAKNIDFCILIFLWHQGFRKLFVKFYFKHFDVIYRFFTKWAGDMVLFAVFRQTFLMQSMAAFDNNQLQMRVFKITHAYRTISFELSNWTIMVIFLFKLHAALTYVTMISAICTPIPADSAFFTMINPFLFKIVIKQITYFAKITRKFDFTIYTLIRRNLQSFTF